jgi:FeS assembly SUF system protein
MAIFGMFSKDRETLPPRAPEAAGAPEARTPGRPGGGADAAAAEPPTAGTPAPAKPPGAAGEDLRDRVIAVLKTCFDPEIPVNIYELGLVYDLRVDAAGAAAVKMTLTSPMCPVAGSLPPEVEAKIRGVEGITDVKVDLVWDPPWTPAMMSEAARLQLNMF